MYLLADRVFIGDKWIEFLLKEKIRFYIRIRENLYIEEFGIKVKVSWFFSNQQKVKTYADARLHGNKVYIAGKQIEGELLIVITNLDRYSALDNYRERWQIESFFSCIKTR